MNTYRYRGHSMSDAQHYRTKDEVEEYKKIDPISQVKKILLDKKYASKDEIEKIDSRVKEKIKECEKFAEESPYPEKNLLYDAVYEQKDYPFLKHKL
jgi:pyruvate dehydrogenase E1 component alpha subunit